MKTLIQRQLYRPALVLPLMGLTRLLVTTDFSLTLTGFILLVRGSRGILVFVLHLPQLTGLTRLVGLPPFGQLKGTDQRTTRQLAEVKRECRPEGRPLADCSAPGRGLCCGH